MQIRKTKNGDRYREEIRLKNGKRISKSFSRKTDAKSWKNRMKLESEKNEALGVTITKKKRLKYSDFSNQWLEQKVKNQCAPSTYAYYTETIKKKILPLVGNLYLDEINSGHGNDLVSILLEKGHVPKGINLIVGILKTSLNEAVKLDLIPRSPLFGFKKLKLPLQKEVYWTDLEIAQFLRANINDPYYSIYVLALNTGMRRGELAGLCWDRVDFKRNVIEVTRIRDRYGLRDTTKSSKKRNIPLNAEAKSILERLLRQQINPKFVFCDAVGEEIDFHHLGRLFKKSQIKAGLGNIIHFHALRHTFASHFMMNGGNIYDLQKLLGHSRMDITERYSHLAPSHLSKAIGIIGFGEVNATALPPKVEDQPENVMMLLS